MLDPHHLMLPRTRIHGARLGVSFLGDQSAQLPEAADAATQQMQQEELQQRQLQQMPGEDGPPAASSQNEFPTWAGTRGLPSVQLVSQNEKYFSPDIADGGGDGAFKPIFGCKCGMWQPAPTHPTIQIRDSFEATHPNFIRRLRKLKVHMEDTTTGKVHWDAAYDLRRFNTPENLARAARPQGSLDLIDTMPADKGSGTQLRFMTFCPPESTGGQAAPHEYSLKVTALDENDQVIDGFVDEESRYVAAPPEPEVSPGPIPNPMAAQHQGPIVAVAKYGNSPQIDQQQQVPQQQQQQSMQQPDGNQSMQQPLQQPDINQPMQQPMQQAAAALTQS